MRNKPCQIYNVYDDTGQLLAVQVPVSLWRRLEPFAQKFLRPAHADGNGGPVENMAEFERFLKVWDFSYAYDPSVTCPHCHVSCQDWRNDSGHPFYLGNANIGGLLVFHCKNCGATIRHKYFRDHMALEFTPPGV